MWGIIAAGVYIVALAVAAGSDLIRYEIPNSTSLALIGSFALLAPSMSLGSSAAHAAAGLAVFAIACAAFAAGICGGGDVKLLGATSLWMGWQNLAAFL